MAALNELLKYLTPISGGMSLRDSLTARRLNAIQNAILAMARGEQIDTKGDIYKKSAPGGYTLYSRGDASSIPAPQRYPFKVSVSGTGVTVALDSWLMSDETWDSKVTITGLGSEIPMDTDYKVWLEVNINPGGSITSATIEYGQTGIPDQWEFFPDPIGFDDPESSSRVQNQYFHLLAYTIAKPTDGTDIYGDYGWPVLAFEAGSQYVVSTTRTNLILCSKCSAVDGSLVYVLTPWFTPFLEQT